MKPPLCVKIYCGGAMIKNSMENLINYKGINAAVVITKEGMNYEYNTNSGDVEMISAIASTIFGSSEQLEKLLGDELEYIVIKGKNSKIALYSIGDMIVGISGDVNHEELKNDILNLEKELHENEL